MLDDITCRRIGAPPLRFSGYRVAHFETQVANVRIYLTVWLRKTRKKQDFVLALSAPERGWRDDAAIVADPAQVVDALERRYDALRPGDRTRPAKSHSPRPGTRCPSTDPGSDGSIALAPELQAFITDIRIRRFGDLVGRALDEWTSAGPDLGAPLKRPV